MIHQDAPHAQHELADAFHAFSDVATRLHGAYESLQKTATHLDEQLAEANRRLQSQVDELENLSGSLAAVLRAIPCGVVVASLDGNILMANPAAERILDVKGVELIGRRADQLVDGRGQPLLRLCDDRDPSDSGDPGKQVGGERTDDGERVLHLQNGARVIDGCVVDVVDAGGGRLGSVEVLNDRSEVVALQEEVRRLDRLAEMGRIAAIIAHEIRNPLAGIRGFAGLLERDLSERDGFETQRRWSRRINEGVVRADGIIDSVLFLARPKPLHRTAIAVESLLLDAFEEIALARPQQLRGIRVSRSVEPSGLVVVGDVVRLRQALSNLIQNAVEELAALAKTAPDSVADGLRLELRGRGVGNHVEISVADSGPGISKEVRESLFEPFFTTKNDGAGLGLALVKRICDLHGGSVRIDAGIDGGAALVLVLPAAGTRTQENSIR